MKINTQNAQSESDLKGTDRVNVAGFFHVHMTHTNDSRVKRDGSALNATIFEAEVLGGTVPGQEGKKVVLYYELGQNSEETDQYCTKVSRLAMACKLIGPGCPDRDIQAEDFEGAQFIVRIDEFAGKKGKGYSVGDFGEAVWGVDHPNVASVPKNADALRLWNEYRGRTSAGNGQAAVGGNGHAPVSTNPTGAAVSTDDI